MTKVTEFKGVITALITPMKDGALDLPSFRRLLKSQVEQGVHGLVINGTTAESPTLNMTEVQTLFETARAETKLPLIVGTGSNSTAHTVEFTRKVMAWRPDGVLVVVPYYNRPPQRGLLQHFRMAAQVSDVPLILYNVPTRTVAALEAETVAELSQIPPIAGIKEASGDMSLLERLQQECRPGFTYLSGDDATCVEFCARGGQGVIAVASHIIGREMDQAIAQAQKGWRQAAVDYKEKYSALLRWLYCEANPIPVKMALHQMGLIDSPELRLPLCTLDKKFHEDLRSCLKSLGKV